MTIQIIKYSMCETGPAPSVDTAIPQKPYGGGRKKKDRQPPNWFWELVYDFCDCLEENGLAPQYTGDPMAYEHIEKMLSKGRNDKATEQRRFEVSKNAKPPKKERFNKDDQVCHSNAGFCFEGKTTRPSSPKPQYPFEYVSDYLRVNSSNTIKGIAHFRLEATPNDTDGSYDIKFIDSSKSDDQNIRYLDACLNGAMWDYYLENDSSKQWQHHTAPSIQNHNARPDSTGKKVATVNYSDIPPGATHAIASCSTPFFATHATNEKLTIVTNLKHPCFSKGKEFVFTVSIVFV